MSIAKINNVAVNTATKFYGLSSPFSKVNGINLRSSFVPNTAVFNGTTNYINRTSAPTGLADAKTFTVSVGLDFSDATRDGTRQQIQFHDADALSIFKNTSNQIQITGENSVGTTILNATSSITKVAADGWFHLYICIDMASTSLRKIYFDGVADPSVTWTTYTNDTLNLVTGTPVYRIGASNGPGNFFEGQMCEYVFNDTYLDNPTAFWANGIPLNIGATGSTPFGSAPVWYLSRNGSGNSWAVDSSGNGNDFTPTGTLGTGTPPTN